MFIELIFLLKLPKFLGVNTTIVRGICKVLGTTLTKYKDPFSQKLVRDLIADLLKVHHDLALEHINGVFKSILAKDLPGASALKASKAAIIALGWTIVVIQNLNKGSKAYKAEYTKLLEYQAQLYQATLHSGNIKISEKTDKVLFEFFESRDDLVDEYFKEFLSKEPSSSVIVFLLLLVRFKHDILQETDFMAENRTKLIDHFVKGLITVKVKPNFNYILSCKLLLKSLTKAEFEASLYPALQRSMLRSPEIVLQGVGYIVQELELDMNDYAITLSKPLVQNLYSKDDTARAESVHSLKQLATKCSSLKTVEDILKHVFNVLNGSDGKITVAEYRMNILQVSL